MKRVIIGLLVLLLTSTAFAVTVSHYKSPDGVGGQNLAPDGSASAPAYSFASDPDTGIYGDGSDSLFFSTGGTGQWGIDASGDFVPFTDNADTIGLDGARPSTIFTYQANLKETTTPPTVLGSALVYTKVDNKLYVKTGDGVEHEVSVDPAGGAHVAGAQIGSPVAEEIGAAGTYEPLPLSLTETQDPNAEWSVQSTNYFCYNGTTTLTNALVSFSFSATKTEQASTQTITFKFGTEQQSTLPMANGDEFGATMNRSFQNTTDTGMGHIEEFMTLATNDCIGVLIDTNSSTPTIQAVGGNLHILIDD